MVAQALRDVSSTNCKTKDFHHKPLAPVRAIWSPEVVKFAVPLAGNLSGPNTSSKFKVLKLE
jgi:hypothetical protein